MADVKVMLMEFLKKEGYFPESDGQAGIIFKKEGRSFFTFPDPSDPNFFNLYSYFDFAGQVSSRQFGLEAANEINKAVKSIKVTLPDDNNPSRVSFGIEVPLPLAESFKGIFDRALNTILYGVDQFSERLRAK